MASRDLRATSGAPSGGPKSPAHAPPPFTLDTSGAVGPIYTPGDQRDYRWPDLDPFTQGTLTAATEELQRLLDAQRHGLWMRVGFANWSPEALALILRDCAAMKSACYRGPDIRGDGVLFWTHRQQGKLSAGFPPLTVALSDDCKVALS